MQQQFTLQTKLKGLVPNIVSTIFIGLLYIYAIFGFNGIITEILTENNWAHWWTPKFKGNEQIFIFGLMYIAFWLSLVFFCGFSLIRWLFHAPESRITLYLNEQEGLVEEMEYYSIAFIYQEKTVIMPCNRIISVAVESSTWGKITNTGKITIKFSTFVSSETKEKEWYILSVGEPNEAKKKLMAIWAKQLMKLNEKKG